MLSRRTLFLPTGVTNRRETPTYETEFPFLHGVWMTCSTALPWDPKLIRRLTCMGPPGFHTTAQEPKCAHFRAHRLFQKDVDMLQITDSELLFIDVRLMFRSHVTTPYLRLYDSRYDSNARKSDCRWQKWLITINHLEIESRDLIQTQKVTTRTLRDCPQIKCWRNPSSPRRHRNSPYYTRICIVMYLPRAPHMNNTFSHVTITDDPRTCNVRIESHLWIQDARETFETLITNCA